MRLLAVALGFAGGFFHGLVLPAFGHDIYMSLRDGSKAGPVGMLCCGGDEKTGDCEAIGNNYRELPDGNWLFQSRRYNAAVVVGVDKVTWSGVAGGEQSAAHWCGVPRTKVFAAPVNQNNPDPVFWTYCAYIAPGGV